MVNYSIAMMGNPAKQEDPKKAYGVAQYSEKMTLEQFSVYRVRYQGQTIEFKCKMTNGEILYTMRIVE